MSSGISRASVQYFISSELYELPLPEAQVGLPLSPFPLGHLYLGNAHSGHSHLGHSHLGRSRLCRFPCLHSSKGPLAQHGAFVMICALQPILV